MEIVTIFASGLFAFHYTGENDNEFDRLMELWTDVNSLKEFFEENNVSKREFFRKNKIDTVDRFVNAVRNEAEKISDTLKKISTKKEPLETFFQSLDDFEIGAKILSRQKGKVLPEILRIYAIKISKDCFVITGGAIKLTKTMDMHSETKKEIPKLDRAKVFLQSNGIFDEDSFYDYLLTNTTL